MTVWSRIRWTNVARAAAGVAALLVVIAWPRLGSAPPRVPDGIPVPVASAQPVDPRLGDAPADRAASAPADGRRDAAMPGATVGAPHRDRAQRPRRPRTRAGGDIAQRRAGAARAGGRGGRPQSRPGRRPAGGTRADADGGRRNAPQANGDGVAGSARPTRRIASPPDVARPRRPVPAPAGIAVPGSRVPDSGVEPSPRGDFDFER